MTVNERRVSAQYTNWILCSIFLMDIFAFIKQERTWKKLGLNKKTVDILVVRIRSLTKFTTMHNANYHID